MDANIYLYRAWKQAGGKPRTEQARQQQACDLLAALLKSFIAKIGENRCIFVFDGPNHRLPRQRILPMYKQHRKTPPDALEALRVQCIEHLLDAGFSVLQLPEAEADDVIAAMAEQSRNAWASIAVVSGDKDLMQVLQPGDIWWDFARQSPLDWRGVGRRLGVTPRQIPDLLALSGDPADNIPGIQGVGQSTAVKLLKKWGSLENLYANLAGVSRMKFRGSALVMHALEAGREQVWLNRQVTGCLPVNLPKSLEHSTPFA